MDGINALIATGGGYRPPSFDINTARQNALVGRGRQLQNQLLEQQVAAQPYQQRLDEQSIALRGLALDIKAKALEQAQIGDPEITLEYPDLGFSLSGRSSKIAYTAEQLAKYPEQAKDPSFMPWVAQQGVSVKTIEPKAYSAKTKEEKLDYEKELAEIKAKYKKGMKVYDAQGNLILDTTGGAGPGIEKKTMGAIEEKLLGGKEQLARIQTIAAEFKPEYQEWGTRLGAAWTSIKAKAGKDIDPKAAQTLTDFKTYQRKAIENINLYIKEMTGAQMSEKEASRLRLAQPDPGEHWWQGDDPITFKAKLDDIIKTTRAAVARYEYYKAKGLGDTEIKGLINSDAAIPLETIASRMQ